MRQETAHIFNENWKAYDNWFDDHPAIFQSEIKAIKKVAPLSGQGLEIGVGTARFASILPAKFGLDPSLNMLKAAREREVKVIQGVGEFLPFKDESFHFVLIVVTICFVSDPRKVRGESLRVLKREGVLILGIIETTFPEHSAIPIRLSSILLLNSKRLKNPSQATAKEDL